MLSAVCPNCHVENSPSNTVCDICKTALGALLVEDRRDTMKWLGISAVISLALFLPCWLLSLHPGLLLLAMFYGPCIASYNARANVVWPAALGGLAAVITIVVFAMVTNWELTKALFGNMVGVDRSTVRHGGATFFLLIGVPLTLLAVLPISLVGASVGELLSVRRRRGGAAGARSIDPASLAAAPPQKMSDEELAKIQV